MGTQSRVIDLRSDTVTKPSEAMRQAMVAAPVGDDVFGEDPTVNELEKKAAAILGKEAALFVASGTMAKLPCPNKSAGCVYTMPSNDIADHLKECIFREMDCPLGAIFGRCSWTGRIKNMMEHFKERHPTYCALSTDTPVELDNINPKEDDRQVFLVAQAKLLFILTFKIDTTQKMAYWAIQHIGGKKVAQQHIYEIHVTSRKDDRRKAVFIEHCFNDAIKSDEVFRQAKCALMPLNYLNNFVINKKLSFRFFIKRLPPPQTNKSEENGKNDFKTPPQYKGQGPKGPGSAFKGPGPKKFFKKPT